MPYPLRHAHAVHEVMDEHPEGIALLERHKDDQWFPHEPVGTHVEEGRSRLVDLVDDPPLIRNQQRHRSVMKQRDVPLALYPCGLPSGEDVCTLPVELLYLGNIQRQPECDLLSSLWGSTNITDISQHCTHHCHRPRRGRRNQTYTNRLTKTRVSSILSQRLARITRAIT
jgi:hypothetical protein